MMNILTLNLLEKIWDVSHKQYLILIQRIINETNIVNISLNAMEKRKKTKTTMGKKLNIIKHISIASFGILTH